MSDSLSRLAGTLALQDIVALWRASVPASRYGGSQKKRKGANSWRSARFRDAATFDVALYMPSFGEK